MDARVRFKHTTYHTQKFDQLIHFVSFRFVRSLTCQCITVSRILGGSAERLNPGATSPSVRETASSVYHVVRGAGHSVINGERIAWKQGDTFCIPAWNEYQHTAAEGLSEPVYLYKFHDKPMLKALGFYRVEGVDVETLVSD
jgi:gentisate 1,2-dioxygenase